MSELTCGCIVGITKMHGDLTHISCTDVSQCHIQCFVWGEYGRKFIEQANEPLRTTISEDEDVFIDLPNMTDLVEKYGKNQTKLLEYLHPIEQLLHETMLGNREIKRENQELHYGVSQLKEKLNQQKEIIKEYESFILKMSHDSYRKEFEGKLKNQVSVNANERNKNAMREVGNLDSFFDFEQKEKNIKEIIPSINEKEPTLLNHWKNIRKN